jgi:hypothetical protein
MKVFVFGKANVSWFRKKWFSKKWFSKKWFSKKWFSKKWFSKKTVRQAVEVNQYRCR